MEKWTGQKKIDWSKVECNMCGNCCPKDCRYWDGVGCVKHPTLVGKKEAFEKRGLKCDINLLELFTYGYYCEPVICIIEDQLDLKAIKKDVGRGVVCISNLEEVSKLSRELRGLRELKED